MNNWNKIINPKTGRKVSIFSKTGKNIINNYLSTLQNGGNYTLYNDKPLTLNELDMIDWDEVRDSPWLLKDENWNIDENSIRALLERHGNTPEWVDTYITKFPDFVNGSTFNLRGERRYSAENMRPSYHKELQDYLYSFNKEQKFFLQKKKKQKQAEKQRRLQQIQSWKNESAALGAKIARR